MADAESRLKQKLFIRYSNGLELTPFGHKVYLLGQSILHQMDLLDNLGNDTGKDCISASLSVSAGNLIFKEYLLFHYLSGSTAEKLDFHLYEAPLEECVSETEAGHSDFSIAVIDEHQKSCLDSLHKKKGLQYTALDEGYLCWHLHRDHPLASLKAIAPDSLAGYPFVRFRQNTDSIFRPEAFQNEEPFIHPEKCITVNHSSSCLSVIRHGSAFMLGNKWQIAELEKQGIKSIPLPPSIRKAHLVLIKGKEDSLSSEAERFLQLFRELYNLDPV